MQNKVYLSSIGLIAPGLESWQESKAVLANNTTYVYKDLPKISPGILPANERRRTTPLIKLALQVAEQCIGNDLSLASHYATVFASSDGDNNILSKMCIAVNLADHPVSPTNFHNSVHNAPAGYWAIAADAQFNSNSLSGGDATFAAGLIEGVSFVSVERKSVLFVAYDIPAPEPLVEKSNISDSFAVAFCLEPYPTDSSFAALSLELDGNLSGEIKYSSCADRKLEELRMANPAAKSLPLLHTLAKKENASIIIPYLQSTSLTINVSQL